MVSVTAFLLLSFFSFVAPQDVLQMQRNQVPLEIRIFSVPPFQSRVLSIEKQEGGGVVGGVLGGNVTSNFPEGFLFLKASSDADLIEIKRLIKKKMASFPCSCGEFIQMNAYARHVIEFDRASGTTNSFEFRGHLLDRFLKLEYILLIEPISVNRNNIWLRFEFKQNFETSRAEKSGNNYLMLDEEIFNRMIDMKPDQVLMVGFAPPKFNIKYRGSAYWFIIRSKNANAD